MIKTYGSLLGALVLCMGGAPVARAMSPCAAELTELCSSATENPTTFARCAREKTQDLSASCQEEVTRARVPAESRRRARRARLREACEPDIERLCPDVPRKRRPVARCLKASGDRVSPACRSVAAKLIARHAS